MFWFFFLCNFQIDTLWHKTEVNFGKLLLWQERNHCRLVEFKITSILNIATVFILNSNIILLEIYIWLGSTSGNNYSIYGNNIHIIWFRFRWEYQCYTTQESLIFSESSLKLSNEVPRTCPKLTLGGSVIRHLPISRSDYVHDLSLILQFDKIVSLQKNWGQVITK